MFYSHFVLTKKGPLAKIWLAAHWERKLTKTQVFDTDIERSVDAIIRPQVKLALRTSGHLLLGVVKIHNRKARYLLSDCTEALVKIKMAFRPGIVDLPSELSTLPPSSVTLPELMPHNFEEAAMMMVNNFIEIELPSEMMVLQSRKEDITLKDDLISNINLIAFDMFEENISFRNSPPNNIEGVGVQRVDNFGDETVMEMESLLENIDNPTPRQGFTPIVPKSNGNDAVTNGHQQFSNDAMVGSNRRKSTAKRRLIMPPSGDEGNEDASVAKIPFRFDNEPENLDFYPVTSFRLDDTSVNDGGRSIRLFENPITPGGPVINDVEMEDMSGERNGVTDGTHGTGDNQGKNADSSVANDQTTLVHGSEAFALEPIDATNFGTSRKAKRKRRLVVDETKSISSNMMQQHFKQVNEIVASLDIAPPSKKLMEWKSQNTCERMILDLPTRFVPSKKLLNFFKNNLTIRSINDDETEGIDVKRDKTGGGRMAAETGGKEETSLEQDHILASEMPRLDANNVSSIANISLRDQPIRTEVTRDDTNIQSPLANVTMARDQSIALEMPREDLNDISLMANMSLDRPRSPSFLIENGRENSLVAEKRLTRSMTKENRSRKSLMPEMENFPLLFATPRKNIDVLGLSTSGNITPLRHLNVERLRTPSRAQGNRTPSKQLFQQNMTPMDKTIERPVLPNLPQTPGNNSFILPPLVPSTPIANNDPSRNFLPFDVSSTFSPLGTIQHRNNQLHKTPEDEQLIKSRSQAEVVQAASELLTGRRERSSVTFKDLLAIIERNMELNVVTPSNNKTKITRKKVASAFASLLELKKRRVLDVQQSAPMGDILVSLGDEYNRSH